MLTLATMQAWIFYCAWSYIFLTPLPNKTSWTTAPKARSFMMTDTII